jgi:UDP-sugar pyrophosphorylase
VRFFENAMKRVATLCLSNKSLFCSRFPRSRHVAFTRRHKTDPNKSLVINVEYNQLDPLLCTQGDGLGDVADPNTGYSPFPGNANNLILELSAYAKTLRGEDQGVVLEFVNPKYSDSTRTAFKKPTRLECMMQDIPKLFQKEMGAEAKIGFTMFDRWFTFSPAKNALDAGQDAVKAGSTAPGTMSSAESDLYVQNQRKLAHLMGANVPVTEHADCVLVAGIPVTPGPRIVLDASFGISPTELSAKLTGTVRITPRSTLVLRGGRHLTITGLDLDGALVIETGDDSHVTVDGLSVANLGWDLEELSPEADHPESVRIRGYTMNKKETREYKIVEPGHFVIDATGQVRKADSGV